MPPSLAQEGEPHCAPRLPTDGDPRAHPAYSGRSAVDLATAQPPARRRVQADASAGPARPAPARAPGSDLADHEPVVDTAGGHADPGHPSRRLPGPPPRSTNSPVGHSGRGTARKADAPDTDTDTWTLRRPHRTPDSGVDRHAWTLDTRTGHRTPDAGRGRGQGDKARQASGRLRDRHDERPPAGTPNRVPVDGARSARQPMTARREATCQRETAYRTTRQTARSLRWPSRASAHCSPRIDFGWSVERAAQVKCYGGCRYGPLRGC